MSGCGAVTGTLTIADLVRDGAALAALGASYDGTCGGNRYLGTVRYRSAEPWWGAHAPAVAFPDTLVGRPTTRDVTVAATGTQPVTLGAASVSVPYSVTADGCAGLTLPPGESCALTVTYAPTWAGRTAPTLTVPSDGPRGTVRVGLSGNALYPPLRPQSLRAVAGYDGIGLSWSEPSPSWNTAAPSGYRVYRDGEPEPVATVPTTYYADPAGPGERHTYTVAAVALDGESARSTPVAATVPASVTTTTGDVTGVAVEGPAGGYATTAVTPSTTPIPGVVILLAGDRYLRVRPVSGSAWAPGTMTAAVDGHSCRSNLAELTVHEARVRADGTPETLAVSGTYDCGGPGYVEARYAATTPLVAGDTTPDEVVAPNTAPGTSTPVSTVTVANGGSVPLDLGAAAAPAGWALSDDTCSGTSLAPGASCTLGVAFAPPAGGVYDGTLTIPDNTPRGHRAVRLAGTSRAVPTAVRDLTATALAGRVLLTWDPPADAYPAVTRYVVARAGAPTGPFKVLSDLVRTPRYSDPYATPGKRFYYRVHATNDVGAGLAATAEAVTVAKELVYAASTGGPYQLTAEGVPGGPPVRLTTSTKAEADPSFHPGGSLAFTREDVPGRFHVYLARPDGTGAQRAAGDVNGVPWTYRNPRLSPDRSRLAFACRPTAQTWWDLCVRSQTSGTVRKVPAVYPSGGSWLASNNELIVVSATTPPTIQIVAFDNSYRIAIPGTANARQVALAPDGSRFAWVRYDGEEGLPQLGGGPLFSLRVSPLSGGAGVPVTTTGYANDPSWSVDGGRVYFTHGSRGPDAPPTRDVFSAAATGGAVTRLTDTPQVDEDHVTVRDLLMPAPSPQAVRPLADFDGNGRVELAVFRPGTGQWRIRGLPTVVWGRLGDIPVAADYNGDRKADRAVFRPSTGTWHVYGRRAVKYGRPGDVPVPADYNGDGRTDLAVFRPSTGQWYVYGRAPVVHGVRGVVPVPADYDGDRRADLAFYHQEWGAWHVHGQRDGGGWEEVGAPAPADYEGIGRVQRAVLAGKYWIREYAVTIATVPRTYNDVPAFGNFNGDRRVEPGVFNPTLGLWRVVGQANVVWGRPGDIAV